MIAEIITFDLMLIKMRSHGTYFIRGTMSIPQFMLKISPVKLLMKAGKQVRRLPLYSREKGAYDQRGFNCVI